MLISIATFPIEIENSLLCDKTVHYLKSFEVGETEPLLEKPFLITLISKPGFLTETPVLNKLDNLLYQEHGSVIIIDDSFSHLKIDITNKSMLIYPKSQTYLEEYDLVNDLKVLLSLLVLEKGGILLHSSAVAQNNDSLLFSGPSGSGKSTISQLLTPQWTLINDEFNILLPYSSNFQVFTTPYGKNKGSQSHATSIRALFLIYKHHSNGIRKIPPVNAFFRLSGNVCTFPSSDYFAEKVLMNIQNIIERVPVYELYFINNQTLTTLLSTKDYLV